MIMSCRDISTLHSAHGEPPCVERFAACNGEVRCLYVVRISREKDLDLLAAAYRRLRNEGLPVQLYIVGHGPYSNAFAKSLPEPFFTGYLTGSDLAAAYASSDVFVFASTTDTFGNRLLEAPAAGLP